MVRVGVSKEDCIEGTDPLPKRLLSEIRGGIDHDRGVFILHPYGTAASFVLRVGGGADTAGAAYDRYSVGRSGSEECYFHGDECIREGGKLLSNRRISENID